MKERTEARRAGVLILLCCAVYFMSYITRHNYAAALAEIVADMGISKQQGSYAVTGMFITYGVGQLLSGWLGDKLPPRWVIFGGLAATGLCNLGMSLLPNITSMTVLWCLNGVAQAMLWPPLVRIMAENLSGEDYRRASVLVSIAASCGSILVYLMVPACIALSGWRLSFLLPAVLSILTAAIWTIAEPKYESKTVQARKVSQTASEKGVMRRAIYLSGLIPIMVGIVLQGMLRDGITTWMPTYITEVYHLQTGASILTTVALPIFSILSISAASALQRKVKSDLNASALLFGLAFAASGVLYFGIRAGAVLSVVCMTLITGCMHGINMLLISRLPAYFQKYGRVSTISGILNTFTYVGSAISAYGFAAFADRYGWNFTILLWAGIALLGTVFLTLSCKRWNRFAKSVSKEQAD